MEPRELQQEPSRARVLWRLLGVAALTALLLAGLLIGRLGFWPFGAPYPRLEHDHSELMVSRTAKASRSITVLFVGNSFTYRNDLPAMLVNLASSDTGNATRLRVQAETSPDAWLGDLFTRPHALDWARDRHPDYVVLQEHSLWYDWTPNAAGQAAARWTAALRSLGETPVLFEIWADGDGSDVYTNRDYGAFGPTPADDARNAAQSTNSLGRQLKLSVVSAGQVFEAARETPGAPNLYAPDHRHPSVAGTYLAALVFYRFFTGRTGAGATWRPDGLSQKDAAMLVRLNGG